MATNRTKIAVRAYAQAVKESGGSCPECGGNFMSRPDAHVECFNKWSDDINEMVEKVMLLVGNSED